MKGERTIVDKPFRYAGIHKDYEKDADDWAEYLPDVMSKCYICGGKMGNIVINGTMLKKTYPYIGVFRITKGKNKGKLKFHVMCRACAYSLGKGVIEMDGYTYHDRYEFNENSFKESLKTGICYNCKHFDEDIQGTGLCSLGGQLDWANMNTMYADDFCSYGERADK